MVFSIFRVTYWVTPQLRFKFLENDSRFTRNCTKFVYLYTKFEWNFVYTQLTNVVSQFLVKRYVFVHAHEKISLTLYVG